jgi:hypothetical protein
MVVLSGTGLSPEKPGMLSSWLFPQAAILCCRMCVGIARVASASLTMLQCIPIAAYFLGECPTVRHQNHAFARLFHKFDSSVTQKPRFCTAAQLFLEDAFISVGLTS